jgi:type 1 glutamine amidotransferase
MKNALALSRRSFLAGAAMVPIAASAENADGPSAPKRIVFIGDKPSHGPGEHECNAGCLLLARLLRENVRGIETVVYRGGWPAVPRAVDKAAAIVLFTNGGPGHPAANHLDEMEPVIKAGAGLVVLHWGLDIGKGLGGERFLEWLGGYYDPEWSVNPFWTARFHNIPSHPVTRGVRPFAMYSEWYYHMRFRKDMAGITPLLTAVPPDETRERPFGPHTGNPEVRARKGMAEHVAWAYERPGGGRGFGFTGGHSQWQWGQDDYRKLVLNAILWSAGAEVPEEGVASATPTWAELCENLDKPLPAGFGREAAEASFRPR